MSPEGRGPRIRRARREDVPAVEALLAAAHLPRAGLRRHLRTFLVAEHGGEVAGSAGLEVYGAAALLRSVAVREDLRRTGLGARLTEAALAEARRAGVREVYLFTMTAPGFFRRFGFLPVDLDGFPTAVRRSPQYRWVQAHPEGVTAMRLRLTLDGAAEGAAGRAGPGGQREHG